MEAATTNPAPARSSVLPAGAPHGPGVDPAVEAQRKIWRDKAARQRAKKQNSLPSPAGGGPPVPPVPAVASQSAAPAGTPGPVPWTPNTLRPLFQTLVPTLEKMDVNSLRRTALEISPAAVATVD